MVDLTVTLLTCPSCGKPLDGLRRDVIFTCAGCRAAWHIRGRKKDKYDLRFAPVVTDIDDPVVYLPLWRLDLEYEASERKEGGRRVVWVSAFYQNRVLFFGDPGMDLTEREVELLEVEEIPDGTRIVGVTSGPGDAAEYARLMIIKMLDRRRDVTGVEVSVEVSGIQLWAVPFAHDVNHGLVTELNTEKSYSTLLVEDFAEIVLG